MKNKQLTYGLLLLLAFGCASPDYQFMPIADQSSHRDPLRSSIDSIVHHAMTKHQIPGLSLGIVRHDSVYYVKGYGVRNISSRRPVDASSVFHSASISKLFTAQAVMQLVREGKLRLGDTVVELIPQIKSKDDRFRQVTLRQLLNHTSGLPDVKNYQWQKNDTSANALEKYILSQNFKLQSAPGQSFQYSNMGYDLLGFIVERTVDIPFEQYVKTTILRESNMPNSDFRYFMLNDTLITSPHGKRRISGSIYPRSFYPYNRAHGPSSTLSTSGRDLCGWMNLVLNDLDTNRSGSIFYDMVQPSTDLNPSIGLGFQLFEIASTKAIGHFGGDKGFRSYLIMLPQKQVGICLLANCDYNEQFREEIAHAILDLLLP